ncbi:MAG TPA: DUF4019 domain-containing protein [Terracidiphilus sp.]|jgi:hypothetical protein|nr:DUF4019 domain-containing protein [Terracidiphilus sp.]
MQRKISIAILALVLCAVVFAQDQAEKQKTAQQNAQSWLALVDGGSYGQSWQEASSFFQSKISRTDWEKALQQVRSPLGAASNRTAIGSSYQTDVPNAPKGEYVVLQYKTDFAGMGAGVETISLMLDHDGKWRIAGYFVKPAQ